MPVINVLLFAGVRELVKQKELIINADRLSEILEKIVFSYPATEQIIKSSAVSVNKEIVNDHSRLVNQGDEIAIIPPISSG